MITNKFNTLVHAKGSHQPRVSVSCTADEGDLVRFCRSINFSLAPGQYVLGFALVTMSQTIYEQLDELPQAEVNNHFKICDVYEKVGTFYIKPHYSHNQDSHFGICNLPGESQLQVLSCKDRR